MAKFQIDVQASLIGGTPYPTYKIIFDGNTDDNNNALAVQEACSLIKLLVSQIDYDMKIIREALVNAAHELTTLHGLRVTDCPDAKRSWIIDTNNTVAIIEKALSKLN